MANNENPSGSKTVWKPVPVALDPELEKEVSQVAKNRGEKKSVVLRAAIRAGLPLIKGGGGGGDVVQLDAQTRVEVDEAVKTTGCPRDRFLLEAIRIGLEEAYWKMEEERLEKQIRENTEESGAAKEAKMDLEGLKYYRRLSRPKEFQLHMARSHAGALNLQLYSLLQNVPEAKEWFDLRMKHWQLTRFWVQISELPIEKLRAMVAEEEAKQNKEAPQPLVSATPTTKKRSKSKK